MGNNSGNGFGFNVGGGGGGGSDTNIGNTNLTSTVADRTYKVASGGTITFQTNGSVDTIQFNDSGAVIVGNPDSDASFTLPTTRPASGNIIKATGADGLTVWGAETDTDENLGNTNLTADNVARTYKVASGGTVTFQTNGGVNTAQMNDSGALVIGGASPYTMPTTRATAQYKVLTATNGTGGLSFETGSNSAAFMFASGSIGAYNAGNYAIPKKNGGAMLENASITIGANNALNLEMFVWDGVRIPIAVRIIALRDAGDAAEGMTFHVMHGTPTESINDVELTAGSAVGSVLTSNSANFQVLSSEITSENYSGAVAGDFFTFGFQAGDVQLDNMKFWGTVYFKDTVEYS